MQWAILIEGALNVLFRVVPFSILVKQHRCAGKKEGT
jgi:hypothetical protein